LCAGGAVPALRDGHVALRLRRYADKLGIAAATGHSLVAKQEFKDLVVSQPGGGVTTSPEFWVAVLWKKLMGTTVLGVQGNRSGTTRVYAHLDPAGKKVGVAVINLGNASQTVDFAVVGTGRPPADTSTSGDGGQPMSRGFTEYALTSYPTTGDLESTGAALNAQRLELDGATGRLPELVGVPRAGSTVNAQGLSVTFAVFQL
jgi:hypothetical protein